MACSFTPWHTKTSPELCCHFRKSLCVWPTLLIESDDRGEWSSCTSEERSPCEDICASGRQLQRERFPSILGGVKGLGSVRRVSNILKPAALSGALKSRRT